MADFQSTDTWSSGILLAADEVWQCKHGTVAITATDPGSATDAGIHLKAGEGVKISSGVTVYHKQAGAVPATVAREAL